MSRRRIALIVALSAAGLALVGNLARRGGSARCALDGGDIDPVYRVRIVDEQGVCRSFCCIRCAQWWLEALKEAPRVVLVTDEAGGDEVEAGRAFFVRSSVVTRPTTRNRVHAFRRRQDADRHAAAAHGRVLQGAARPFAGE